MDAAQLVPLLIAVPAVMACAVAAAHPVVPRWVVDGLVTSTLAALLVGSTLLLIEASHGRRVTWAGGWSPHHGMSVGVVLVVDRMGAGLAVLITSLALCAYVYSWHYIEEGAPHYEPLLLLFVAGMVGFTLSADLFDMFVMFELMGATAYALTGVKVEDPSSVQGSFNFGVINSLGAYLSVMGIGLIYARHGQLGLPQIGTMIGERPADALTRVAFLLVITGFLVKAAAAPFHFWLEDAHAVAPAPVCLLFSGVMVVLGVYGVVRVYWDGFSGAISPATMHALLLVLGLLTAAIGLLMCLVQQHLKRLLAYSTIAHVGLFLIALATMGEDGTAAVAIYVLGHAAAKGSLFLIGGLLLDRRGTVEVDRLHGAGRGERLLPILFAVACLELAGLPPFCAGLGKASAEDAVIHQGDAGLVIAFIAVSAGTAGAALRAGGRIWLGLGDPPKKSSAQSEPEEKPDTTGRFDRLPSFMVAPIIVLLTAGLALGVLPGLPAAARRAAADLLDRQAFADAALRGGASVATHAASTGWTATGVALGLTSAVLAVATAAVGLYGARVVRRLPHGAQRLTRPMRAVEALHSGHVGDYAVWMFAGVCGLGLLMSAVR